MKKIFILLLLALFALEARSQEFLNANKRKIKSEMSARGGILYDKSDVLTCVFPRAIVEKTDINFIGFFLKQDKCYKYVVKYATGKNLKSIIRKFDDPNSGYKRSGKGLNWMNADCDKIKILDNFRDGVKTNAFWLEMSKKNSKHYLSGKIIVFNLIQLNQPKLYLCCSNEQNRYPVH